MIFVSKTFIIFINYTFTLAFDPITAPHLIWAVEGIPAMSFYRKEITDTIYSLTVFFDQLNRLWNKGDGFLC
jgi:hypothetical protein